MTDPIADARRAADHARAGVRLYEDAILSEADRQERLANLQASGQRRSQAEMAAKFPALRGRLGQPGGGVA